MTQIKDDNGNWVVVAGGQRTWVGTKAALQTALNNSEIPEGTPAMVTDDYAEGTEIVDVVENNNMKAITSNAVYDALMTITPVDAVTSGNMNPVTSNAVAKMCKHISVYNLADKVIPTTGTVVTQLTLPKGKWMVFGQLHTNGFASANQLLTLAISVNGTASQEEVVDQKVQVPGYWIFVHGMLYFEPTTEVTVKLVAVATEQIVGVAKAEMFAIQVAG